MPDHDAAPTTGTTPEVGQAGGGRRLALESLAIVGSILLAFAIDAWWDSSRERGDARDLAAVLHEELVETQNHLDVVEEAAVTRVGFIRTALVSPDEMLSMPVEETLPVLSSLSAPITFDPSRGALTALLSGGALEKIDDAELRAAISSLPGALDDIHEEGEFLVHSMQQMQARMVELGLTSEAFLLMSGEAAPERGRDLLRRFITDARMREQLAEAATISTVLLEELSALKARLSALTQQLEEY